MTTFAAAVLKDLIEVMILRFSALGISRSETSGTGICVLKFDYASSASVGC
jgi:hypothetical protein